MKIPLIMLTDSACLFNLISRASKTSKRRLMIYLESIREAYNNKEIDGIKWILTTGNIADAFTKVSTNEGLEALLDTGILQ